MKMVNLSDPGLSVITCFVCLGSEVVFDIFV